MLIKIISNIQGITYQVNDTVLNLHLLGSYHLYKSKQFDEKAMLETDFSNIELAPLFKSISALDENYISKKNTTTEQIEDYQDDTIIITIEDGPLAKLSKSNCKVISIPESRNKLPYLSCDSLKNYLHSIADDDLKDYLRAFLLLSIEKDTSHIEDDLHLAEKNIFKEFINLGYRLACLVMKYNIILNNSPSPKQDSQKNSISDDYEIFVQKVKHVNKLVNEKTPWKVYKENPQEAKASVEELSKYFYELTYLSFPFMPLISQKFKDFFSGKIESLDKFNDFSSLRNYITSQTNRFYTHALKKKELPGIPISTNQGQIDFISYYKVFKNIFNTQDIDYSFFLSSNFLDKNEYKDKFGSMFAGKQVPVNGNVYWASESNLQTFPFLLSKKIYNKVFLSLVQRFRSETVRPDDLWRQKNIFPCLGLNGVFEDSSENVLSKFKKVYEAFFKEIDIDTTFFWFDKGEYGKGHLICSLSNEVQWTAVGMIYLLGDMFQTDSESLTMLNSGITGKVISYKNILNEKRAFPKIFSDKQFIDSSLVYIHKKCAEDSNFNVIAEHIEGAKNNCFQCNSLTHPILVSRHANFY